MTKFLKRTLLTTQICMQVLPRSGLLLANPIQWGIQDCSMGWGLMNGPPGSELLKVRNAGNNLSG